MKCIIAVLLSVVSLTLLAIPSARAGYILVKDVLSECGGHMESSSYTVDFCTGQTAVGQSECSTYVETGGFWNWPPGGPAVGVEEEDEEELEMVPDDYQLSQNYPNPFNPQTHIRYQLAQPGPVSLAVYNVRGQMICRLVDEEQPAGEHQVTWQGVDHLGRSVASGIYFYQLVAGEFVQTRKMLLLK